MSHNASIDRGLAEAERHARYGCRMTYQEIAKYCGCSWQRIHQIEQKALRRLRQPTRINQLKNHLS